VQALKEQVEQKVTATHSIMPVPSCDNVDDWEAVKRVVEKLQNVNYGCKSVFEACFGAKK